MASFTVGDRFMTFTEVEKKIHQYEKEKFVQFYKRDSRRIEAAKKRAPNKNFNKEIVYSELVYSCIHGGKSLRARVKERGQINSKPKACVCYVAI